jgi:hypothetical protein
MTREAFEAALDSGRLETLLQTILGTRGEPRWYRCRRNGRTRTWKRDTTRFAIPIKFRLKNCDLITSEDFYSGEVDKWFRISKSEFGGG